MSEVETLWSWSKAIVVVLAAVAIFCVIVLFMATLAWAVYSVWGVVL